jgi:hypothetical protein
VNWNALSLVLACATGWSLLFLGYLPIATLRELTTEPVKGAGAWAIVAVTAPAAIFHWYLIFAVISLIAWTKLGRPAGKIWLAIGAALGLSLGIVFPLATSAHLAGLNDPLALASLYLGGAATGLAYVTWQLAFDTSGILQRGLARALAIIPSAWALLLACALRRPLLASSPSVFPAIAWAALLLGAGLAALAWLTWAQARRGRPVAVRLLAGAAALVALAASFAAELALRTN